MIAALCALLMIVELACLVVFAALAIMASPGEAEAIEFVARPKDRPVLETVQQVMKARTTGISEFDFNGVHYVNANMPKEYVDYSSWYCRMP